MNGAYDMSAYQTQGYREGIWEICEDTIVSHSPEGEWVLHASNIDHITFRRVQQSGGLYEDTFVRVKNNVRSDPLGRYPAIKGGFCEALSAFATRNHVPLVQKDETRGVSTDVIPPQTDWQDSGAPTDDPFPYQSDPGAGFFPKDPAWWQANFNPHHPFFARNVILSVLGVLGVLGLVLFLTQMTGMRSIFSSPGLLFLIIILSSNRKKKHRRHK